MFKVICGGQTGIDQMGLDIAMATGLETGGTAAKGWMTEEGPMEERLRGHGLIECEKPGYPARTWKNVMDSDMTVIFGDPKSPGSLRTIRYCKILGKECVINPSANQLINLIKDRKPQTINIAGNRASKLTDAAERRAQMTMYTVFLAIKAQQNERKNKDIQGEEANL